MNNLRFCLFVVFIILVCLGGIVQAVDPVPMGSLTNSNTYLNILTYDGSNQLTHPCVLYREGGWNGYTYLMVMTPLPYWEASFENPCMRYSNDGINWVQIPGQPEPILEQPRPGFYSDVNIELVDNTLYLFYRWAETMPENSHCYYRYITTTDGIHWTDPVQTNLPPSRSNSFIYNGTGWESWEHTITGETTVFEHFTSADAITWKKSGLISLDTSTFTPWHSEVKKYDNKYMLLMVETPARDLRFYTSDDGVTWQLENNNLPVLYGRPGMWDSQLYKSSFVEIDNTYKVWYAAFGADSAARVGYTHYPNTSGIIPMAQFTANPKTGTAPLTVSFTDTSNDFTKPITYLWDFGDGETSSVQNPSHKYTTAGTYSVNLTVTDQKGGSDFEYKSHYITVNEVTPLLTVTANPTTVTAGSPTSVKFRVKNATSNQDISGALVTLSGGLAPGSGTTGITGADGNTTISVIATSTITATASKLGYTDGTTTVTTNAAIPVASFIADGYDGTAPLYVQFTDTSFNNPTTWSWSFRNVTGNNTQVVFSALPDPVHTFGTGNYSIVLDASNSAGHGISTQETFINVSALILPPVARFTPSVTRGTAPLDIQFTDTSFNNPTTWSWSFRNVTGNNTQVVFSTLPDPVHTFGIGNYSIVLDASNSAGHGISTQGTFINVTSVPSVNPTTRVGVYLNGEWWLDANGDGSWNNGDEYHAFGSPGVQAVTGDWNHDGKDEIGVFYNGGWWLDANGSRIWDAGDEYYAFGSPGVQAVTGDWNHDGKDEMGVFYNGEWWLDANGSGIWDAGDEHYAFGSPGVQAVTGDWNHDGNDEMGVFYNGEWWLDANGSGIWDAGDEYHAFGSPGVQAVTGDWNHDGKDEMGVFYNGDWWLDVNGDGSWNNGDEYHAFGSPGVQAVTGVWKLVQ
jgi:PKD repeat protein